LVNALRTGDESSAVSTTRAYYERVDQKLMGLLHALAGITPSSAPPPEAAVASGPNGNGPNGSNGNGSNGNGESRAQHSVPEN
ncbi:MAG TPA: hypothetical protein VJU61_08505, partial [Polyangiaceae bacterium]|nr:hypothetical protein [Polyangiaceae bacterium]